MRCIRRENERKKRMSYDRSTKKEANTRLSLFGQRLQSLSDSFYSTILEDPKEKQLIESADQFDEHRHYPKRLSV